VSSVYGDKGMHIQCLGLINWRRCWNSQNNDWSEGALRINSRKTDTTSFLKGIESKGVRTLRGISACKCHIV